MVISLIFAVFRGFSAVVSLPTRVRNGSYTLRGVTTHATRRSADLHDVMRPNVTREYCYTVIAPAAAATTTTELVLTAFSGTTRASRTRMSPFWILR